jgi:hypothetical protein
MTSRSSATLSCLVVLVACAACDPTTDPPDDAGRDAATSDDAGGEDAGLPDAGDLDANVPDANVPDANLPDADVPDASPPDAGELDAGFDAGDDDDGALQCSVPGSSGTATCEDTPTELVSLVACCDDTAGDACGAMLPPIPGSPLSGCFAKGRAGNPSQHCGAFFDQLDGEGADDGAYTFTIGVDVIALPGCCTPTGLCGVTMDEITLQGKTLALGYGCIPFDRFRAPPNSEDAGAAEAPALPPYCVPQRATADVACPPKMSSSVGANLCERLADEGLPLVGCDPEAATAPWICASKSWPELSTGQVPAAGECMHFLPTTVHGCGVGQTADGCVPNIDAAIAGCVKPQGR